MRREFEKYCKDYTNIENFEKAKKDNFKGWHCHHRLETHTPDGKRREVDIGYKELKSLGLYYNRPAEELIFLTTRDHNAYNNGKKRSAETRRKMKGNKNALGYKHSDETRRKMAEAHKGKNIWTKGMHWYNNGKINIKAKECPEGFVPGILR